jgi:FKBP-type peptidyl-prolyl cis-trans isomerase FklB
MLDGKEGKPLMADESARAFIMGFINQREAGKAAKQAELNKETYKDYIAQNEAFLAKNKEKAGVTVTASGLQYEVIKMGTGPKPTAENTVKVHYVGTLIDGTEFDSSVKRNTPAEFPVTGVIPGWTEALQLMPVGSKFKLCLPESIAYGANGAGEVIKPFSTLIFEVELLEITK